MSSQSSPPDTHQWVSFSDPGEYRTWVFDVTFLLSSWTCIFGAGCQGVLTEDASDLVQGCCSYGAHYVDAEDQRSTEEAAKLLSPEEWQFIKLGTSARGVSQGPAKSRQTRLVDDACIFLNRPGFAAGPGCAFHTHALNHDLPPATLKPEVCWQLPLRRDEAVGPDGHVTTTISQWDRRHWGEGGADFHWWCTEAPEAFSGKVAVWRSMEDELTRLCSRPVYELLAQYLGDLEKRASVPLAHPVLRPAKDKKLRKKA